MRSGDDVRGLGSERCFQLPHEFRIEDVREEIPARVDARRRNIRKSQQVQIPQPAIPDNVGGLIQRRLSNGDAAVAGSRENPLSNTLSQGPFSRRLDQVLSGSICSRVSTARISDPGSLDDLEAGANSIDSYRDRSRSMRSALICSR